MGRPSLQQARAASGAQTARLSDGVTAYQVEGTSGPWVVLVHGLLTPMFAWEGVSSVLAREGYRVLRYDAFGRGLSDRPNIRYELPLYVRQLRELMDMIGIETMHLVSWSMGGLIASHFARERPDGVGSQVLIAPALFLRQPWALRIPLAMPRGERLIARRMGKIADDLVRSHLGRPERYPDYRARLSEQLSYPGLASSFASTLKHFAWQAGDELQDVGQHSRPVLVIWGDADRTTPYANAQRVLALYSKATLHTVPGARHAPHLDHAELVEPALVGFLATAGRVHSPSNSAVVPK